MNLLYWSSLSPEGDDGLAAIRFVVPIQISSICVFPNGAQPFANAPHVVARTEPESFFLEVFLNAHTLVADAKEKPRINALVPTLIAYPGGHLSFPVNMGSEYATRLMIVKGKFSVLSMAIYGEVVTDTPFPTQSYQPQPSEPISLSRAINPANSNDPTFLAKQLLALIPDAPPLSLVVRLMFCLKPSHDDWNLPEFPYLHVDLDKQMEEELDFESIIQAVSRPVRDDTPNETLSNFGVRVAKCPKSSDYAYHIANLLSISASQLPGLARALLCHLDLCSIFNVQNLDEGTLLCLLDAVANVDIARHLNNEDFFKVLHELRTSFKTGKPTRLAAQRLSYRIQHWSYFEDALSNAQGDFNQCVDMLKEVTSEEQAMGTWLESMITHEDIVIKLGENPVLPTQSLPPLRLHTTMNIASHHDFITSVRAFVGVASVLAVWAYTDERGNDICRERTLAVLHLWQGVDGYREIVNYMLLLRQLTRRLKWIITDNELPKKSGILAEKVLTNLAKEPHAVLQHEVIDAILSLRLPLSFITEDELRALQKVAYVSEDGLPAAVDELLFSSDHPLSHRRLRVLRVALTILEREMGTTEGEWRTFQTFRDWEGQSPGIVSCLGDLLTGVSADLNGYFAVSSSGINEALIEQLFRAADDVFRLLNQITLALPLNSRSMRQLTIAVADIFACTDLAEMMFPQTSTARMSAQGTGQTCLDLIRALTTSRISAEPERLGAEIVFRTLLQHAADSNGRDPTYHSLRVFTMVDYILPEVDHIHPEGDSYHWVTSVLPNALEEIKSTFQHLDPDNKAHFLKRLVSLDEGVIEIGKWILIEELKALHAALESLTSPLHRAEYRLILQYQVSLSIQFIQDLGEPSSTLSLWFTHAISTTPDLSSAVSTSLMALIDGHHTSRRLQRLISILARSAKSFDADLQFAILLAGLRASQNEDSTSELLGDLIEILQDIPLTSLDAGPLRLEFGKTLLSYAHRQLDMATSESILSALDWLSHQDTAKFAALSVITAESFSTLCTSLLSSLPESKHEILSSLRSKLTIDEGLEEDVPLPEVILPESLTLPLRAINDFFQHTISTASTPPHGTKTPDILGVIISPPTAILRAHGIMSTTGLTKTYSNNDFRQLRQVPSARQNTSRLPSMHVDVGINGRLPL